MLVVLVTTQTACAQPGSLTRFEDRLAKRIAEDDLVYNLAGPDRRFPFFVDEPKEWPWDIRLALGIVTATAPDVLNGKVDTFKFNLERTVIAMTPLAEKLSYVDNTLKVASNAASADADMGSRWLDFQEARELRRNEALTTVEQAVHVLQVGSTAGHQRA